MAEILPALFAGLFLGAGIFAVTQVRTSSVNGKMFWLVSFLSFAVAGLCAVLRLFFIGIEPIYVTVMAFALSVGMVAALIGVASHLVRPLPERWTTIVLAIPVVIYVVAVLTDQIRSTGMVQIVTLIGFTGLAAWKFETAPRASMWVLAAALSFAILPALLMRLAPGLGISFQDVGHLAGALGVLALAQASLAKGNPDA